jgi:hypothetical protein
MKTFTLYEYPSQAYYGRPVAKSKIYEHAKPGSSIKKLLTDQVVQIVWEYKLAPETINIPQTKLINEIQIFKVALKNGELNNAVLRAIDSAVHSQLIYELTFEDKIKCIACCKLPDNNKMMLSNYFETDWLPISSKRVSLPVVLNLHALYEKLISPLLPIPALHGETLVQRVERIALIQEKEKEILKCEHNLRKVKQFNRKVEMNGELRRLKQELEQLVINRSLPAACSTPSGL